MAEKANGGAKPIRISDVAKPGKSAPSASSKPIIVTNRPVLRDPMMVDDEPGEKESGGTTLPLSHLKIAPLSDETKAATEDKAAEEPKPKEVTDDKTEESSEPKSKPIDTEPKADPEPATKSKATTDAKDAETSKTDVSAEPEPTVDKEADLTVDDDADAEAKSDPTDQHVAEADQAAADLRAKELDDLVESRKYYLPINQVEKRRAKHYAWAGILLIVLLAVAWGDVALDAGLISIPGVKPLTHFFSN